MTKYKKKPVTINAEVYSLGMEDAWGVVCSDGITIQRVCSSKKVAEDYLDRNSHLGESIFPVISTLEGWHIIQERDYIITGIKGERYPCKPNIFIETYEKVKE